MRADQDVDLSLPEVGEHLLHLTRRAKARDHLDAHREVAVARAERMPVLLGEDGRRREHQRLLAVDGDGERRTDRALGLPEPDVAADEPVHGSRRLEVFLDGLDRGLLVGRLPVRELGFEPLEPVVSQVVREARCLLALRVQREQLTGELAHGSARAVLEVLPSLAAQLRQRRRRVVGADVARDLAELLVRDVQAVVATEAEEEGVARDGGDVFRLDPEQLSDPVVLVHDVVAGAEIRERLQRPASDAALARRTLAEDLRIRKQHETQIAPDEAAPRRRDGEEHLRLTRESVAVLEQTRVGAAQQVLLAQGLAEVGKRNDDPVARAHERVELVLCLRQTTRDERRPLRFERERLVRRQRVEPRGAADRDRLEPLFLPDPAHLVHFPDDVRAGGNRRNEISRHRYRLIVVRERGLDEVEPAFGGRIDGRRLDRVQSPLGERREGADLLDLVAPELDAQRLASRRREDVDKATAYCELPALVGALDSLVTGERERLGELLEADLLARCDAHRLRALLL